MLLIQPSDLRMNGKVDDHPKVHIPTVYEHFDAQPAQWEYHVLTLDARESALPDADTLNALGKEGWIMVGLLDERTSGNGSLLHFYFVRQARDKE
jgi:hypothetical protein